MNLRAELGAPSVPEFTMDLPEGWARHSVDDTTLGNFLALSKKRAMETHQLQMYGDIKAQLESAFSAMKKQGVFAFFCPTSPGESTIAIPSSINASIRNGAPGQSLDDMARSLIRDRGARPLLGDPRTLRFETEKTARVGAETIINHSAVYLTPVPGTNRRQALSLVAGFARTVDMATDAESVQAMRFLLDACVSTLRWGPSTAR